MKCRLTIWLDDRGCEYEAIPDGNTTSMQAVGCAAAYLAAVFAREAGCGPEKALETIQKQALSLMGNLGPSEDVPMNDEE